MLYFESDYTEGAHPRVLEALCRTNMEHLSGYGGDLYSDRAKEKIRKECACPDADIYFLTGGTQTNQTVIDSLLCPYEGVIAAESGHIATHEAGAIEFTGHKVLSLPQYAGKISADDLCTYLGGFHSDENREHMVQPGMVYISHPTEYGTIYSKAELQSISEVCREFSIPLYIDGARLGYGIMSRESELTLPDIAALCDVFYIGGTKVGALCGEAVVFTRKNAPSHFITRVKQHGALLAKGRLTGIQFDTLFTDGLYFEISRHAIEMAEKLREVFLKKGYRSYIDTPTNQIFIVLSDGQMSRLRELVKFSFWERLDGEHCLVRFATSWATEEKDIDELEKIL